MATPARARARAQAREAVRANGIAQPPTPDFDAQFVLSQVSTHGAAIQSSAAQLQSMMSNIVTLVCALQGQVAEATARADTAEQQLAAELEKAKAMKAKPKVRAGG